MIVDQVIVGGQGTENDGTVTLSYRDSLGRVKAKLVYESRVVQDPSNESRYVSEVRKLEKGEYFTVDIRNKEFVRPKTAKPLTREQAAHVSDLETMTAAGEIQKDLTHVPKLEVLQDILTE